MKDISAFGKMPRGKGFVLLPELERLVNPHHDFFTLWEVGEDVEE